LKTEALVFSLSRSASSSSGASCAAVSAPLQMQRYAAVQFSKRRELIFLLLFWISVLDAQIAW